MFICIYMNILIYNQEKKRMSNAKQLTKKPPKTFIYRSINKDTIRDSLYSTWVFACLGKSWERRETAVIKGFEILLKCKMAPKNRSGGQKRKKKQHVSWFPVFSVFLVNAASLFILAQTWVKSLTVRHDDTHRPVQHQPQGRKFSQSRTMLTISRYTGTLKSRWS